MKIIINKDEFWINDEIELPSNFNSMSDNEKWNYIFDNKLLHREDGPAIICYRGSKWWFLNGLRHRLNGPAYVFYNGYKEWCLNDKMVYGKIYKKIENSSKEKLLMYAVLPKYKDYLSLIDYRLSII